MKCHTNRMHFNMPALMHAVQCEQIKSEKLRCLLSSIMASVQAMTFWEVLWAEDYHNQMDQWTPATSTGESTHIMVSISFVEGAPLKDR